MKEVREKVMPVVNLFIGTYTGAAGGKGGDGIYTFGLDTVSGALTLRSVCRETENPSFLTRRGDVLYACEELSKRSAVAAFRIRKQGQLFRLGRTATKESGMCHVALWPAGDFLTASDFDSASLVIFQLEKDGNIGPVSRILRHQGSGPHPQMQRSAHVHSATFLGDDGHFLVCDLGNDTMTVYQTAADGSVRLIQTVAAAPGDGPRHAAVSPDGKSVTVLMQLSSFCATYRIAPEGLGEQISRVSMLPEGFTGRNDAADVHYSPNGRHVYASNRGHDSIVVYDVKKDGALEHARWFPSFGSEPRHFCILPAGDMAVITNQATGNVVTVRLDPVTGDLGEKLCEACVPQAVFAGLF